MASGRMSTPWMLISRSPLALSMRMSVLAPGQPTAVRTSLRGGRLTRSRSGRGRARRWRWSLEDPAVDLEHLGELAADVDAARKGDVADVVLARVVAVALAGVAGKGLHLLLDVALLEPHVGLVREVEVVPGDLVGQHRGALEGAQALLGDGLVVLVQVDEGGHHHAVWVELLLEDDHLLEDVLAHGGEGAHLEVEDLEVALGDAEDARGGADLVLEDVFREALRDALGGRAEGGVGDLDAVLDEARHGAAAAELAVVGVRRPRAPIRGSACGLASRRRTPRRWPSTPGSTARPHSSRRTSSPRPGRLLTSAARPIAMPSRSFVGTVGCWYCTVGTEGIQTTSAAAR